MPYFAFTNSELSFGLEGRTLDESITRIKVQHLHLPHQRSHIRGSTHAPHVTTEKKAMNKEDQTEREILIYEDLGISKSFKGT